jgi:small subunit ribosomal protein S17
MPRRVLQGIVVSNKMDKTAIVKVESNVMHPVFKKYIKRHKKYAAHDANNLCEIGQTVRIIECPPFSKRKAWLVQDETQV